MNPTSSKGSPAVSSGVKFALLALGGLLVLLAGSAPARAQGPSGAYAFSEGAGTAAADISGNGNNGTLQTGATWTTSGKYGNAITFNGTTGFVSIPDSASLDLGDTGTIEAWVKPAVVNRWSSVMAKGNLNTDNTTDYGLEINDSNQFLCILGNGGLAQLATSTTTVVAGTFYHVACVWNGVQLQVYVNGALNTAATQIVTPLANTSPLFIGQYGGNMDRMNGVIDEIRIYSRGLTQAQVQSDMNTPLAPLGPAPTVSAINPTSGLQGQTKSIVVTGTNFLTGPTCGFGAGVTVNSCTTNTSTQITAGITVAANAALGTRSVTVTNTDAQSATLANAFTVNQAAPPPPPTLTSISPTSGQQGQAFNVTFTGGNFLSGASCSLGAGITVNSCTVNSATQITAAISIAAGASAGTRSATVTNTDAQSATLANAFTINAAPSPTLTGVSPASGLQGQTLNVTLTGTNFLAGASCSLGAGITINSCTVNSATQITTGVTIAAAAATGTRSVTVTNAGGQNATLANSFTVNAAAPPPATAASYPLNEGTGLTAGDISGNGNNGTLQTGATWTAAGKYGNGLSFDGATGFVSIPDSNSLDLPANGTIEAWVKPAAINRWSSVMAKGTLNSDFTTNYGLEINDSNHFLCILGTGTAAITATSTTTVAAGTFYHVACVWNGAQLQLFVNGAVNITVTQNIPPASNTSPLFIGQYAGNADRMNGIIDEVRIYNRALSTAEVQTDMNTPLGAPPPPDTTAPTVSMTAPADGAVVSTTVTVSANASDNVGVVGVQFLVDGASLGSEDTSSPYSVSWNSATVSNGAHTLSARARDLAGNSTTSALVHVTVSNAAPDTTPPVVSMTAPANGSSVTGSVTVSANASDNVGVAGVQFLLDGASLGTEVTTAPYSISWSSSTASSGVHTLSARARDAAGNQTTSATVSVTVTGGVQGLMAAYGFNEGTGTTVNDLSGNNNFGSVNNTAWTATGKFGGALVFNGTNSWITVADSPTLDLTTGMTLEAWVNPTTLGTAWETTMLKEQTGGLVYSLYANSDTTRPSGHVSVAGAESNTRGTAALATNTWSHVATTYDGTTLRLYVNGVQVSTKTVGGPIQASTGALRIGGNNIWGEWFNGLIDEIRIYNRPLAVTEIQTDMSTPVTGAAPPPDTIPPTVAVTAPANGATVTGLTTLNASASDNVAVAGVRFFIDGVASGAEITSAPFTTTWSSTTSSNGSHAITAVARDVAGNQTTSAPITVTVANTGNPAIIGAWGAAFDWPIVAINMVVTRTGDVISWDGPPSNGGTSALLWSVSTGQFTAVPNNRTNMFCNAGVVLADGRILTMGGHSDFGVGLKNADIYDPTTKLWTAVASMSHARWYPTATVLPDGRVLTMSGSDTCETCIVSIPEIYNPGNNTWTALTSAPLTVAIYPHMFVLPDGRILQAGASRKAEVTSVLDLNTQAWTVVDPNPVDGHSSVMYELGKIMKSGTSADVSSSTAPAAATTYTLDMTQANPKWQQTANMAFPRAYHNLTILPDGSVLTTGGGTTRDGVNYANQVLAAELWSPTTKTWSTMASEQFGRLYHGNAVLMLDGRVLVSGSGRVGPTPQFNAEIYSPPYLFKGARPTISGAPASATYGSAMQINTPNAASITSVTLLRISAATHAINMDQRFLKLNFSQISGGLSVTAPANANMAPPGYYVLFILNSSGVPSVGSVVQIH